MLKNLSLKTKLWIFISSAIILVLVIMSAAIFGKGTLFQGFLPAGMEIPEDGTEIVIEANNESLALAQLSPQQSVTLFSFSLRNTTEDPQRLVDLRININPLESISNIHAVTSTGIKVIGAPSSEDALPDFTGATIPPVLADTLNHLIAFRFAPDFILNPGDENEMIFAIKADIAEGFSGTITTTLQNIDLSSIKFSDESGPPEGFPLVIPGIGILPASADGNSYTPLLGLDAPLSNAITFTPGPLITETTDTSADSGDEGGGSTMTEDESVVETDAGAGDGSGADGSSGAEEETDETGEPEEIILTISSVAFTPAPSPEIQRSAETNLLKFKVRSDRDLDLDAFSFQILPQPALTMFPPGDFQEFKLFEETSTATNLLTQLNADALQAFRTNGGNLEIFLPEANRDLATGETGRTFVVSAKLVGNATPNNAFKLKLVSLRTIEIAGATLEFSGLPIESSQFSVSAPVETSGTSSSGSSSSASGSPSPSGFSNSSGSSSATLDTQISALENQIETLRQQIVQASQNRNSNLLDALNEQLQEVVRNRNSAVETQADMEAENRQGGNRVAAGAGRGTTSTGTTSAGQRALTLGDTPIEGEVEALAQINQAGMRAAAEAMAQTAPSVSATLANTARLHSAPERGDTGPGLIAYFVAVGGAQAFYFFKKRKHKS